MTGSFAIISSSANTHDHFMLASCKHELFEQLVTIALAKLLTAPEPPSGKGLHVCLKCMSYSIFTPSFVNKSKEIHSEKIDRHHLLAYTPPKPSNRGALARNSHNSSTTTSNSTRHSISRILMPALNPSAMLLEPIHKSEHARLRGPSQIRVIDMLQTKSGRLSRTPFEI